MKSEPNSRLPPDLFAGRENELRELESGLDESIAGRGRIFMIEGEAGIGKTRLAQELASRATKQGVCVLWGRCYEDAGVPPYWPWIEIIRSYLESHDRGQMEHVLGTGAPDIAEIVPEIRQTLPDLPVSQRLEPAESRFRLFDSITASLKRASKIEPLLLILDNLHCADRSSLRLVEMVAQHVARWPLLVVGTCRDGSLLRDHPVTETLGELSGHAHFQQMSLAALTEAEVADFVSGALETKTPAEITKAVHRRTDGNPLFVLEVIRVLLHDRGTMSENAERSVAGGRTIPSAIRSAISKRLNRLSQSCNRVLIVASVLGPDFRIEELQCVFGERTVGEVAEAVDEALRASFLEEAAGSGERYRFTHDLIRDAISGQLTASKKRELHLQIGTALEKHYHGRTDAHVVELAHHFSRAGAVAGIEKVVHYLSAAAETALSTYAVQEAAVYYRSALATLARLPMDSRKATVLTGLGRALLLSSERDEAQRYLTQAFEYYEAEGEAASAADVVDFSIAPAFGTRWSPAAAYLVDVLTRRALELVASDSLEAGRLLCQIGIYHNIEHGYDSASAILKKALDIARRKGDLPLEARILAGWAQMAVVNLRMDDLIVRSAEAIRIARNAQVVQTERYVLHLRAVHFLARGNPSEAQMHLDALFRIEQSLRSGWMRGPGNDLQQIMSFFSGNWDLAREHTRWALERDPTDVFSLQILACLEYEIGNLDESDSCIRKIVSVIQSHTGRGPNLAGALACIGLAKLSQVSDRDVRTELANSVAESLLASPIADPFVKLHARVALCLSALYGDKTSLPKQRKIEEIEILKGYMLPWGSLSVSRLLGLVYEALGQREIAERHYRDAISLCAKAGYRPELAWSLYNYSGFLLSQNDMENREAANSSLDQAATIARGLGMKSLAEAIHQTTSENILPAGGLRELPSNLSKREIEVLRLIARGMTNREIAYDLFISEHTVGNHVSRILAKTHSTNRTEAALFASRNGLTET